MRNVPSKEEPMNTYHILSLDGGGIRGLLTVALLERLERARPGFLDQIDLFAGTSTGAFLALGLAYGLTPTDLRKLYDDQGKWIFQDSLLDNLRDLGFVRGARYSNKHLKQALTERFCSHTLGDLKKKVLVAAFDLDNGSVNLDKPRMWKAKFFHNFSGDDSDADERIVDVALRSSAAPTYFPVYQGYVDGFVVANNPSMCALTQVIGAEERSESAEITDIALLSVGTGLNQRYLPQKNADWGLRQWAIQFPRRQHQLYVMPLIYMMWEGSVDLANYQCRQLLGDRFHRLDALLPQLVDIDGVEQMGVLAEAARQMDLKQTLRWLDAHFLHQETAGEAEHDPLAVYREA
jgi:patatin-like phospholipase/acyl hydrolase